MTRSLRWVALGSALSLIVAGAAALMLTRSSRVGASCIDVAADVGLIFQNEPGTTVADSENQLIMQRNMGNGAAVGDFDDDGDLDVYLLAQAGYPNRLFRNDLSDETKGFTDVTEHAGVGDLGQSRVAHFADLDGDGRLDLLVVNDTDPGGELGPSRLFRNNGDGTFADVTAGSGFHPVGYIVGGAAITDHDSDGDLDIYVSYWTMELAADTKSAVPHGVFPGSNRLYENEGGFKFADVTDASGLGGVSLDSFTAIFHDFDGDRDPDLYVAVDHRSDIYYENIDGSFVDRSELAGVDHVGNDMGIAAADIDGNGYLDLYLTNVSDPALIFGTLPRGNTLLMVGPGDRGGVHFTDHASEFEVTDTGWGWGTAFSDIDLDGDLDLFAVQGFDAWVSRHRRGPGQGARAADATLTKALLTARSRLFLNDGGRPFRVAEDSGCDQAGDQRALVPFDYDRDGDADFLITQIRAPTLLLENRTRGNHWLTVILDDRGSHSVGAEVAVTAGDHTVRQVVLGGGSYLAGNAHEAYFGLGAAKKADRVEITWDDGTQLVFTDVPADQILDVGSAT